MAMTQERFQSLIGRLEGYARRDPAGYRLRVGLLAALGYAYILLILGIVCGLLALLVMAAVHSRFSGAFIKIGLFLGTLAFIILRALWVRFPPPEGLELTRAQVPRLFDMVDELTTRLQAPRFHRVLLTNDFNAAVLQVPRLGLFGWQVNYLLLGLPLMQALSPEQFRAVVAHELGHLSGNHSRFAGWTYRVRQTWDQLLDRLAEDRHAGTFLFEWFLKWYVPFFNAYSFVLARADEYVADRCAVELAGASNAAEALLQVELKGRFLEKSFWPEVHKQVDQQPEPPPRLFTNMLPALRSPLPSDDAALWLDRALAEKTGYADTHPSLTDRLTAIGYLKPADDSGEKPRPPVPPPPEETAAQRYCGSALETLADRLDQEWREQVAPHWRERYTHAQETQRRLAELEEKAQREPLTDQEAWNRAEWTAEFRGTEVALPLLREFLATHPEHALASFTLGRLLLEQNDATGIEYLEKAMERDSDAVLPACQILYGFLKEQGRDDEAERYRDRAEGQIERLMKAQAQRASLRDKDPLEPHDQPPAVIDRLREQLSAHQHVGVAYLVTKPTPELPDKPLYLLAIDTKYAWYKFHSDGDDAKLAQRLAEELEFPAEMLVVVLGSETRWLSKRLKKMQGVEIYRREGR